MPFSVKDGYPSVEDLACRNKMMQSASQFKKTDILLGAMTPQR